MRDRRQVIQKARFYSFFQVMMIIGDFVCTEIGEDDIMIIQIDSLQGQGRSNLRASAIYVEPTNSTRTRTSPRR